jgi:hypothetical protein
MWCHTWGLPGIGKIYSDSLPNTSLNLSNSHAIFWQSLAYGKSKCVCIAKINPRLLALERGDYDLSATIVISRFQLQTYTLWHIYIYMGRW